MHGTLKCAEKQNGVSQIKLMYKDLYVFLFDMIMIFTVEVTNKLKYKPLESLYYYKDHILVRFQKLHHLS